MKPTIGQAPMRKKGSVTNIAMPAKTASSSLEIAGAQRAMRPQPHGENLCVERASIGHGSASCFARLGEQNITLHAGQEAPRRAQNFSEAGGCRQGQRSRRPRPCARSRASSPKSSERFRAADPEPRSELEYVNPFTLLVAVVLSAQATDAGVNKATRALFAVADTPQKMLALGEERLRDMIKTIGLYRNKAKNIIALSAKLVEEYRRRGAALARRCSKPCRASDARPPMSFSTPPSASR